MPQMAPMNWTIMFLYFTTILMIILVMMYYSYIPNIFSNKSNNKLITNNKMNWKW